MAARQPVAHEIATQFSMDLKQLDLRSLGTFVLAAVSATIVGDTGFQVATGDFFDLSIGQMIWRAVLFLGATVGLWVGLRFLQWWLSRHKRILIGGVHDVESHPALVAFVSLENTSHETAVEHHLQLTAPAQRRLRYVRLIPSAQSEDRAREYAARLETEFGLTARVHPPADFFDAQRMYEASEAAITATVREAPDLESAKDVVIDVTGGTAIATIGATLAGADSDATLQYVVPRIEGRRLNFAKEVVQIKRVDVSWVNAWARGMTPFR